MFRRFLVAAAVLALASDVTAVSPANTHAAVGAHRLIVAVKSNLAPAAEKRLAILVLISQNGGAPAAALATPRKALTVLLDNRGPYRIKAEIDAGCTGSCAGSYRIAGTANHKLQVVPTCRPKGRGFVCSKVKIVQIY